MNEDSIWRMLDTDGVTILKFETSMLNTDENYLIEVSGMFTCRPSILISMLKV